MDEATINEITPELEKHQQLQMLIATRWIITFVLFERELYENPDQDLNTLWWKTVSEVQLVTPPDSTDNPVGQQKFILHSHLFTIKIIS